MSFEKLLVVKKEEMQNQNYSIQVLPYACQQYRIQLLSSTSYSTFQGEKLYDILREMCTYKLPTMLQTVEALRTAEDPFEYTCTLERPYNCESPRYGRIRLDNVEGMLGEVTDANQKKRGTA